MPPSVSVIIPSALKSAPDGRLWLARAVESVMRQTLPPQEIIVGLDPGAEIPRAAPFTCIRNSRDGGPEWVATHFRIDGQDRAIKTAHGNVRGHQAACNAAAKVASGRLLGFLEDDDEWDPKHLETLVGVMEQTGADFVSTSQVECSPEGEIWTESDIVGPAPEGQGIAVATAPRPRIFDFPTASGWLLPKQLWDALGGFNQRLRIHHDNAFLGKLNRSRLVPSTSGQPIFLHDGGKIDPPVPANRVHVVEAGFDPCASHRRAAHLDLIGRHARVVAVAGLELPTVRRTIHAGSVMGGVALDPERAALSRREYEWCMVEYGEISW